MFLMKMFPIVNVHKAWKGGCQFKVLYSIPYLTQCATQKRFLTKSTYNFSPSLFNKNASVALNRKEDLKFKLPKNSKGFCFDDYDVIGFDLDGTLVRYNLNEMVSMVHDHLRDFLIHQRRYPDEVLGHIMNWDFIQKGLVIDIPRGNIVKANHKAKVIKATHGTTPLSDINLQEIYGKEKIWDAAKELLVDPLHAWQVPLSLKIRATYDYFDICAPWVFANVVDFVDSQKCGRLAHRKTNYTRNWQDVLDALYFIYSKDSSLQDPSPFFASLLQFPEQYLLKTNDKVIDQITKLKENGKLVFLLTGSNIDYANFIATYGMGEDWHQLFDFIITSGKKPQFFTSENQFHVVKSEYCLTDQILGLEEDLKMNSIYCKGNWKQLLRTMAKILRKPIEEVNVLHIGDSLIQDVYAPVKHFEKMEAVAICEELLEKDTNFDFHKTISSQFWGSFFNDNHQKFLIPFILENYAKLLISTSNVIALLPFEGTSRDLRTIDLIADKEKIESFSYFKDLPKLSQKIFRV